MNVRDALYEAVNLLRLTSPTPRLDGELLLMHVAGLSRAQLFSRAEERLLPEHLVAFRALVQRRCEHEPIAYLSGEKEFWSLPFVVTPDVLIPRPETEILVEWCLAYGEERRSSNKEPIEILDCGTGSGCIVLSVAHAFRDKGIPFRCCGIDISEKALSIASTNRERLALEQEVSLLVSDWFSALPSEARFDIVVANPPYIADGDTDRSPETAYEPELALLGGADGLRDVRTILEEGYSKLCCGGALLLEIGKGREQVISMAEAIGYVLHPARSTRQHLAFERPN